MQEKKQSQEQKKQQLMQRVVNGELSQLNPEERLTYYNLVCDSVGLNPLTRPFEYLNQKGKLILYAKKDATEQLGKIHGISVIIKSRDVMHETFIVIAAARDKTGRDNEALGAVTIRNLAGEDLANAMMKAESKAKRRAILSLVGLGFMDETEVEDIPDKEKVLMTTAVPEGKQKNTSAAQPKQEQSTEPKKIEFCIKQKAEKENKGRKFYQLAILEESSGELKTVFVLKPADIEVINNGLQNGNLRYSGILNTVRENLCLEQLQVLEDSTEQKAS